MALGTKNIVNAVELIHTCTYAVVSHVIHDVTRTCLTEYILLLLICYLSLYIVALIIVMNSVI